MKQFISDAQDNDKQPTNFYCAGCSLALVSDGLVGSPLIWAVQEGKEVQIIEQQLAVLPDNSKQERQYILQINGGE